MNNFYKRTWAEINLDALKGNIAKIAELSPDKEIIAVVKANAYGHGDVKCAKTLQGCGIKHFAVSNLLEAKRLKSAGISGEIIIFGYCDTDLAVKESQSGLVFTVGDEKYAKELSAAAVKNNTKVPVHIKIDTGMSRVGITTKEQLDEILSQKGLDCLGAYTHFAVADSLDEKDMEFTKLQQSRILELCRGKGLVVHTQNSGGIVYHKDFEADLVRAGIIMYGHRPDARFPLPEGIKPVMSLKSVVSQIKTIKAGDTVSYGRTFTADREIRLALIPCGYADGFNRRLSGQWSVLINGQKAPVRGRICMDQTLADITNIPNVNVGDEVTIFSDEKFGGNSFTEAAELVGTISYELLCAVGARVPRVYFENGKEAAEEYYFSFTGEDY